MAHQVRSGMVPGTKFIKDTELEEQLRCRGMYSQCDSMDSLPAHHFQEVNLTQHCFPNSPSSQLFFLISPTRQSLYCKPTFESDVASTRQDLTQVDRNLITIRELNYLLSDRMFARRCLGELHGGSVFVVGRCDFPKKTVCLFGGGVHY